MTSVRSYFTLAFVAVIFLVLKTSANLKCCGNKTIADKGTHCPDCFQVRCERCALQNVTDCYCKEGYMLVGNGNNNCVKPEDCPICVGCSCAQNIG